MKRVSVAFLFFVLFFGSSAVADLENEEENAYIVGEKRYFAGVNSHRGMVLYLGSSLYSDSSEKNYKPNAFSSWIIGFQQQIKEVPDMGDFNLKAELQNFRLNKDRATQINITPIFSLPEIENGFPVYVGLGAGMGFYPYLILRNKPFLSLNAQFFVGLRLINFYKNLGLNAELLLHIHRPFLDNRLYMNTMGNLGVIFSF